MAEMVCTLMKNDQVTHLFTIFNYVVIPAPAILAHPSLRTEAIRFLAAIQVLEFFGEDQGFIKFLLPVQATAVLSMRNFPLLSRLVCRNAQLVDLSFKNYALALDASYNDILKDLSTTYGRVKMAMPRNIDEILTDNHESDQSVVARHA